MTNIVRMWGTADGHDLIYTKGADGKWRTSVPADLSDGMYVCEIYALDESGWEAYWAGVLYINNGRICVHLCQTPYKLWLLTNETEIALADDMTRIDAASDQVMLTAVPDEIKITYEGSCCCGYKAV